MVRPISEFEKDSLKSVRDSIDQYAVREDPVDGLVEDLRSEFRRGIRRETANAKAAKRMRRRVLFISLLALAAAAIGTAVAIEIASRHAH